jgi:hypothetical protein
MIKQLSQTYCPFNDPFADISFTNTQLTQPEVLSRYGGTRGIESGAKDDIICGYFLTKNHSSLSLSYVEGPNNKWKCQE